MHKVCPKLVFCAFVALAFLSHTKAQSTVKADDALKSVLLKRGDDFMEAWKKHDSAALNAILAPEFVTVGGSVLTTGASDTVRALMNCEVKSYSITESSLKQLSQTAAILLSKQQQQITCFGHLGPPVVYTTDTYVNRNGKWLLLVHTEAVPDSH